LPRRWGAASLLRIGPTARPSVLPCWEKSISAISADLLLTNYNLDTQLPAEAAAREQGEEGAAEIFY